MPRLLPAVFGAGFLPLAELCAAVHDGDLMAFDGNFICVDEPDRADLRASALKMQFPDVEASKHLVAMGWSAAWVHGVLDGAPWQHEVCVRADERASVHLSPRFRQRELRLTDDEEMFIGDLRVTTPARTARDLTRFAVGASGTSVGLDVEDIRRRLDQLVTPAAVGALGPARTR